MAAGSTTNKDETTISIYRDISLCWGNGHVVHTATCSLPRLNTERYPFFCLKNPTMSFWDYKKYKIYIIQCEQFFKIGYTGGRVRDRLNGIRSSNPYELHLLCVFRAANEKEAKQTEKILHEIHNSKRISGEWYELDYKAIDAIKEYLKDDIEIENPYPDIVIHSESTSKEKYWKTRWRNTRSKLKTMNFKLSCEKAKTERLSKQLKRYNNG